MNTRSLTTTKITAFMFAALGAAPLCSAAEAPTPKQALDLTPIQKLVEYTTPPEGDVAQCTIRPEKENSVTSWVVRNPQGVILRRFADSNNDNVVDEWCYFLNGIEVYRDIDSNFNGKADEYRWFNTAGTRWGVDKNEDRVIDSWKVISPHEVAEQVVLALKAHDDARFQLLLMTPAELTALGVGPAQEQSIAATLKAAPAAFSKLINEQKVVTPQSRYVDFGSARPGTIPAGTAGSTKDVIVCNDAAALIQTADKHDQIFLGTLVQVGEAWRLIDVPSENQGQIAGMFAQNPPASGNPGGDNAPSDEMQKLMAELENLDKVAATLTPEQIPDNIEKHILVLKKLAELAQGIDREQWYRQLIDVLSGAIQSGNYKQGLDRLTELQKTLTDAKADDDLIAHCGFQKMWAEYLLSQRDPNADDATKLKVQQKWLADLQAFVAQYPKAGDTSEALWQLGMYLEIMGKPADAAKSYQQLVADFPQTRPGQRANGALTRLNLSGKPIKLSGPAIQGGTVDISSPQYRGKVVLVHYWSTGGGERWKQDLATLFDVNAKRGGRDFDIIGVCLDDDPNVAKQFIAQKKLPWKQLYEKGGLDGRFATEMGVITLPLMILVDQKGVVANPNVQAAELETELAKVIKAPAGTANALRSPPTSSR